MSRDSDGGANWKCPYCKAHQAVVDARFDQRKTCIYNDKSVLGKVGLAITSVVCANPECKKMTLWVALIERKHDGQYDGFDAGDEIQRWHLLPESLAKPQPDYIPAPIRDDYYEACRIRDLSAKASATLSRRCLQGMIRDFCGITRRQLIDEIKELRRQVDEGKAPAGVQPDSIDAIDHVRSIGNIGAHMEKDINLIVDVDPDEAQTLIDLLELLFEEWYVARQDRRERLAKLGLVAKAKDAAKLPKPPAALPAPEAEAAKPAPSAPGASSTA